MRRPIAALRLPVAAVVLVVGSSLGLAGTAQATGIGPGGPLPCNSYGFAGTPCVAAYSTVRALSTAYNGPLYQVTRASDNGTLDIGLLPGGIADAAAQDAFCVDTSCTITKIYDQSPQHNDLNIEGPGGFSGPGPNGSDLGAPADALPIQMHGQKVYGIKISPGMGYRDNETSGVAAHGQPESMYMVTSSNFVNTGCCFDFGNAETNGRDNGNGHMDAVYFGTRCGRYPPCYGQGPWVQADLENGLFKSDVGSSLNPSDTGFRDPFVTALLKNNGQDFFALKGGNAQRGQLITTYAGPLPTTIPGYSPMQQEGAIVLGTGGDNSNRDSGEFFEGVMTAGVPPDWADNAVQANIAAAGYGR